MSDFPSLYGGSQFENVGVVMKMPRLPQLVGYFYCRFGVVIQGGDSCVQVSQKDKEDLKLNISNPHLSTFRVQWIRFFFSSSLAFVGC